MNITPVDREAMSRVVAQVHPPPRAWTKEGKKDPGNQRRPTAWNMPRSMEEKLTELVRRDPTLNRSDHMCRAFALYLVALGED